MKNKSSIDQKLNYALSSDFEEISKDFGHRKKTRTHFLMYRNGKQQNQGRNTI